MRGLRIAAYVVGGLLALLVVLMIGVTLFVDPNNYRDDIERLVQRQTGRELTLSGKLKLSVFPWLALETGPATLGDAPGFGPEPFVSIREARVGVRLWPLLGGRIEAGHVRLDGARIRLITDERGRNNWSDLGGKEETQTPTTPGRPMQLPTIAGLDIRDAAVTIEDRQQKTRRTVRDFSLATGRLASGEPFDLKTDFILDQEPALSAKVHLAAKVTADLERNAHRLVEPEIDVTLSGQGYPGEGVPVQVRASSLSADIGQKLYRLEGLGVTTTWKGDGLPQAGIPVALKAPDLNANLAAQTLELQGLDLDVAGARLSGALTGAEILDAPKLRGTLKLEPVALRDWMKKLGVELPRTRDSGAFKRLSFSSAVALTKTSAELGNIVLQLDDTTAKGMLGVADFASKALRFDLNVDRIDADRYLPPPVDAPAAKPDKSPPVEIPVEGLRKLNARGDLRIGEAIFSGIKFSKLHLGVNARDGRVRFHPSEASMYGGEYSGDIGIDATGKMARITLDEHVKAVDFAPLFKDFFKTSRVSGKGSANIRLAGAGRTTDDVAKTLDGAVDFNVANGALEGTDLVYEIRRAGALLKQKPVPERPGGPPRTPFNTLAGTGVMKNGVLTNNDLTAAMQYLKVTGQGTVDVPQTLLDYRLTAAILKMPPESAQSAPPASAAPTAPAADLKDLVEAQIPIRITGALTDPKVRVDVEGLVKSQAKERLEKEKSKVEEKLKDKLKDLFNR